MSSKRAAGRQEVEVLTKALQATGTIDLTVLSSDDLRERLASAMGRTAEGLVEMAACVRELEARGEDLSGLHMAILPYLRRIAYGQLLPRLVIAYAGTPKLLSHASTLPLPDQERLLAEGTVEVAVAERDGSIGSRRIDPRAIPPRDLARIFSEEGIVAPERQQPRKRNPRAAGRTFAVRVDRERRRLLVGRMAVPIAEVMLALSEAAGYGGEIDDDARQQNLMPRAVTNLTPEEKERLGALAKAMNLEEREVVRRAILTWLI